MAKKIFNWIWSNFDQASDILSVIGAAYLFFRYLWWDPKPSASELSAGILAILSILAISGFVEKRSRLTRMEKLVSNGNQLLLDKVVNRVKADDFFQRDQSYSDELFAYADKIYISGITLGKTIRQFTSILSARLIAGADIRIIILASEKNVTNQIDLRSFGKIEDGYYKNRLKSTIDLIRITGNVKDAKGTLSVGLLPYVPSFGIIMTDPKTEQGKAFIEIYHHNSSDPTPNFSLTSSNDPYWFTFFENQFELMWEKTIEKIIITESDNKRSVK